MVGTAEGRNSRKEVTEQLKTMLTGWIGIMYRPTDRQTDRRTDGQTETDRQTDIQIKEVIVVKVTAVHVADSSRSDGW